MFIALLFAVELAGGWSTHGPHSISTSMVAVAAGSNRRVFAAGSQYEAGSSIFRSDDGGSSWERLTEAPAAEYFLALESDLSPSNPDRLFAASMHLDDSGYTTRPVGRRRDELGASSDARSGVLLRHRVRRRRAGHRLCLLRRHLRGLSKRRRRRELQCLSLAFFGRVSRLRTGRHAGRGVGIPAVGQP